MKTIEQQKADLLDELFGEHDVMNMEVSNEDIWESLNVIYEKYIRIGEPIHESNDPYIDEVFDMRICNVICDILNKEVKKIKLSDCPHISKLDKRKNIGFGSIQAYESTMQKYGLNDKLI